MAPESSSSHLGRPKGVTPKYSLKPLVPRLSELLEIEVKMASDCIGPEVEKLVAELPERGVLLLKMSDSIRRKKRTILNLQRSLHH